MSKNPGKKRAEKVKKRQQKKKDELRPSSSHAEAVSPTIWPYERNADDDFDSDEPDIGFSGDLGPMQVRRLMEREMAKLIGREFGDTGPVDPKTAALQQAQELCFEAMEARSAKQAEKLAKQALKVSPDCAEAYNVLADLADNVSAELGFYEAGVEAGRRALADEWDGLIADDAFWGYLPSRPFMRAMQGKADSLWGVGRRDEAIATYLEMLHLNPGDNQGIRSIVVPMLIEMNRDADASKVLNQFKEKSCFALSDRALLEFRKSGDCDKSRKALRKALKANPYVVREILYDRPSETAPDSYSWQSPEEARCYVDLARRAWKTTAGAIAWLRKTTKDDPPIPTQRIQSADDEIDDLLELPQLDEVWEVSIMMMRPQDMTSGVNASDGPTWMISLNRTSDRFPLGTDVHDDEPPTANEVWDFLVDFMQYPDQGAPRRPSRIECLDEDLFDALAERLGRIDVGAEIPEDVAERLAIQEEIYASAERFEGPLAELPLAEGEAWVIECRQIDAFIPNEEGEMSRPWVFLIAGAEGIVHTFMSLTSPSEAEWVGELERAIRQTRCGEPRRPERVLVRSADHRLLLQPFCEQHGIYCEVGPAELLDGMVALFDDLCQHMRGPVERLAYCEVAGMTHPQLESFFEATAAYYRSAPWQFTPSDSAWQIKSAANGETWWAVVMGQNGETYGLALYDDWDSLVDNMTGDIDPEDPLGGVSCVSLMFSEAHGLTGADLDAIEQFGWPIPTPEAYPMVIRVTSDGEFATPSSEEFHALESVLRTLPDFIKSRQPTGQVRTELHDGTCELEITKLGPKDLRPRRGSKRPRRG